MTSTASSSTSCRAELAAYLASNLAQARQANPGTPISATLIESLIAGFERASDGPGQRQLSLVSEFDQLALTTEQDESKAVAATLREASAPAVVAAADDGANNAGILATLVVEENRDMRA
ncbi:hypothetical protein [Massilia orientalis]|uniref:Uncharacterized protein n=1 Tax=Massilia orientalis TaxID=3050128 RepID=A0ACC7MDP1_9BURK|nr:hypothetical protein [Massilia sp. YIM B02787]